MSSAAMAGEATRASSALPQAKVATSQVRHSTKVDKKSKLASGAIIPLVLGAGIVAGGVIIAVDNNGNADSPG
ncbi:hypothetical protein [Stakelama marina]|uniref:Uncharacterized protein n=1 Tax=Stakelama marina TaxID=2826939 RepID=A0A8T4INM7_9SPHN|nr:hypothetical protein [Stakelama marina]MBR0553929.1 hypothetical protein [Stakelama marina]